MPRVNRSVESLRHSDPLGCGYSHTAPRQPVVRNREIMLLTAAAASAGVS